MSKQLNAITIIILAIALCFNMNGCKNFNTVDDSTQIVHTNKKIEGNITAYSDFSEGLAFVNTNGDNSKTYCINKDGYIVFELDKSYSNTTGSIYLEFISGYALIDGGICNTKGEFTYPKDVGVTNFYDTAFKSGYVIAEIKTSTYNSSKNEIGIMNMDFEWIVEPNETLYNAINEELPEIKRLDTYAYCIDDYVYFTKSDKYLNLKTGVVTNDLDINVPSDCWMLYSHTDNSKTYFTYKFDKETLLDLTQYEGIIKAGEFVNGKAPVVFYNEVAGTLFLTFINEKGELNFEPVQLDLTTIGELEFDGNYCVISDRTIGTDKLQCYDAEGKLIGETTDESFDIRKGILFSGIRDGIISIWSGDCYYFNPDFTALF